MSSPLRLSLVGDYRADAVAHQAIPLAIERAARWLSQNCNSATPSGWCPVAPIEMMPACLTHSAGCVKPESLFLAPAVDSSMR